MSISSVRFVILPMLLLALFAACSSDKGEGPSVPPDQPDLTGGSLIWVDSVDVSPGTQAVIDVFARLGKPTQAVTLPFLLDGTDFVIDSMSFRGTLLDNHPVWQYDSIIESVIIVSMAYWQEDAVGPDSGRLLKLHVSVDESAPSQTITVDTTSVLLENGSVASLILVDTTTNPHPNQYIPEFQPGLLRVADQPTLSHRLP